MAYLEGFNANQIDPNEPQQAVPAGTYLAIIEKSEKKKTKSGNGEMLELKFKIQDGQHKGRTVTERLNLWNQNETARAIAWGDMSAICRAVGVMQPNDSNDLHNIPLEIIVGVTNPDEKGRMYNEINGYQKRGASAAPAQSSAQTPAPNNQPAQTPGDKPSWMGGGN